MTYSGYYSGYKYEEPQSEWRVEKDLPYLPRTNIVFSWVGYVLFGLIIYASYKKNIYRSYLHNVFLILAYACIIDILKMGHTVSLVGSLPDKYERDSTPVKTTVLACTLYGALFWAHITSTLIEAFICIHRIVAHTCGRTAPVKPVYIGLALFFGFEATILIYSLLFGIWQGYVQVPGSISCRGIYMPNPSGDIVVNIQMILTAFWTLVSIWIAPVLSMVMIIKAAVKKERYSGVTAFIMASSGSLLGAVISAFLAIDGRHYGFNQNYARQVAIVAYLIQYFRFPLLCIIASLAVTEIRRAVAATISEIYHRITLQRVSFAADYEVCLEEKNKEEKIDNVALP